MPRGDGTEGQERVIKLCRELTRRLELTTTLNRTQRLTFADNLASICLADEVNQTLDIARRTPVRISENFGTELTPTSQLPARNLM